MSIDHRIAALRTAMAARGLSAYVQPSSDPHQSEYVADYWQSRAWLSGFDGSAGLVIVTPDHAGLWTDSRYFLQAEEQLRNNEVELHRQRVPHAPEHRDWLAENLPEGATVGLDGRLFSAARIAALRKILNAKGIALRTDVDLIGEVWTDRPALPEAPVFAVTDEIVGTDRRTKLGILRDRVPGAAYLLSTLDDIAWTLNLRGTDVAFNPVFYAYLLVLPDRATLFINKAKVSVGLKAALAADGVQLAPYRAVEEALRALDTGLTVYYDAATLNARLVGLLKDKTTETGPNVAAQFKGIKNDTEIAHIRTAMAKDGVALTQLFCWVETALAAGRSITEADVAEHLDACRRAQGDYYGESFPAIVGYQANGAIIHYRPHPDTAATLRPEGLLLLDSGGQYTQGTTDITRTVALGPITADQQLHFTLVLKGHIALAKAHFPQGTTGVQLDTLARQFLWQHGLNYGHGTGHGVGFFLNVHEGPQRISPNPRPASTQLPLEPGMLTSNEPGYYRDGAYGIRTENLILCTDVDYAGSEQFLRHETLTLFPIDRRCILVERLSPAELDWLNGYHARVAETLLPLLADEEQKAWMRAACAPLAP